MHGNQGRCSTHLPIVKRAILIVLAIVYLAFTAYAADIAGKWWVDTSAETASQGGRGGSVMGGEFDFKVTGDELSGSASAAGPHGQWMLVPITDGRITGDTVSFTVIRKDMAGNDYQSRYTGKVAGARIELTVDTGRGNPRTLTLKRPGSLPPRRSSMR